MEYKGKIHGRLGNKYFHNDNLFKFTKRKCNWSRLHPIHAKAMNGFYAPFYKL